MQAGTNYFEYHRQLAVPGAAIRLTNFQVDRPMDARFQQDEGYWLDYSLTPRTPNARGCFLMDKRRPHYEPFGSVFMLPPGETLLARSDSGEQMSLLCILEKDRIANWLDEDFSWTDRHLDASMDVQAAQVVQLLRRLAEELRRPSIASDILCEAIAVQLAIELARYYGSLEERAELGGLAGWRLRLIDERVRDCEVPPTLQELADLCGLSVRQLTRGFRATRGRSLGEHITDMRMDRAKRMLCGGETVKEISYSLGFSSPSSFCYAFRRETGHSPRQFRLFAGRA